MKIRRTDLAMEAQELWRESAGETTRLSGVEARDGEREGIPVTTVRILDREGEQALGKPQGTYVTLTLEGVAGRAEGVFGRAIRAVCEKLRPACVIAVDALASRSLERLCRTVQLADTGITPGSGVGNHRVALDRDSLGVPVLALGVPTVVEGSTLAADLMGADELPDLGAGRDLLVTPKDIDSQVADLSKIVGYGISLALQPGMTVEDLELLLS